MTGAIFHCIYEKLMSFIRQKTDYTDVENKLMVARVGEWREGIVRVWD